MSSGVGDHIWRPSALTLPYPRPPPYEMVLAYLSPTGCLRLDHW
jgi:hypothetical protein